MRNGWTCLESEVWQQGALQLGLDNGLRSGQAVHLINVGHHIVDWAADGLLRRGFRRLDAVMPAAVIAARLGTGRERHDGLGSGEIGQRTACCGEAFAASTR